MWTFFLNFQYKNSFSNFMTMWLKHWPVEEMISKPNNLKFFKYFTRLFLLAKSFAPSHKQKAFNFSTSLCTELRRKPSRPHCHRGLVTAGGPFQDSSIILAVKVLLVQALFFWFMATLGEKSRDGCINNASSGWKLDRAEKKMLL